MVFELVCEYSIKNFNQKVNNYMKQGFKPVGGHTVSDYSKNEFDNTKAICISMIKE